jgi:hypothetical protein
MRLLASRREDRYRSASLTLSTPRQIDPGGYTGRYSASCLATTLLEMKLCLSAWSLRDQCRRTVHSRTVDELVFNALPIVSTPLTSRSSFPTRSRPSARCALRLQRESRMASYRYGTAINGVISDSKADVNARAEENNFDVEKWHSNDKPREPWPFPVGFGDLGPWALMQRRTSMDGKEETDVRSAR